MAGNLARAIPALDALLANGEDPHRILAQLAGSVELAAVMEQAGGRDPVAVGKDLKLSNPARMSAIARSVRNLPPGAAVEEARVLEVTDRGIKTGVLRDPVDALYQAVARIGTLSFECLLPRNHHQVPAPSVTADVSSALIQRRQYHVRRAPRGQSGTYLSTACSQN